MTCATFDFVTLIVGPAALLAAIVAGGVLAAWLTDLRRARFGKGGAR